jgi:hypothetical protein
MLDADIVAASPTNFHPQRKVRPFGRRSLYAKDSFSSIIGGGMSMSTGAMTQRIAEASPRFKARMAGVCQLLEATTAAYGQVIVLGSLVVADNAAATAANILGHELLFWLGFTSSLPGGCVSYRLGVSLI